nr:PREDICTED: uncharacterized protein LOC109033981 [Bemisia tabaci]
MLRAGQGQGRATAIEATTTTKTTPATPGDHRRHRAASSLNQHLTHCQVPSHLLTKMEPSPLRPRHNHHTCEPRTRMTSEWLIGVICVLLSIAPSYGFPTPSTSASSSSESSGRKGKALDFTNLDIFASSDYNNLADDIDSVYYDQLGSDAVKNYAANYDAELAANDELSRARPTSIRGDSNIYYIRLPPTPYMFVPGVGYVSQPPNLRLPPVVQSEPQSPIVNVPVNFVSNGKPTGIYTIEHDKPVWPKPMQNQWTTPAPAPQWGWQQNQSWQQRPTQNDVRPAVIKPPKKPGDSDLYYLNKGPYKFNGRPTDIFLLRNAYDSLYSDTLQSFYP